MRKSGPLPLFSPRRLIFRKKGISQKRKLICEKFKLHRLLLFLTIPILRFFFYQDMYKRQTLPLRSLQDYSSHSRTMLKNLIKSLNSCQRNLCNYSLFETIKQGRTTVQQFDQCCRARIISLSPSKKTYHFISLPCLQKPGRNFILSKSCGATYDGYFLI